MEKFGFIEIHVNGSKGNLDLSPDHYDIREIIAILETAEDLIYPGDKKDRPVISYKIEKGSVKHIFKTSLQYIIGFNAILGQIDFLKTIDFLDLPTAKAFENIQGIAAKRDYTFTVSTSVENSNNLEVSKNTNFVRTEAIWADAEFYFYGKITNAGGKDKANIHLLTDDLGMLRIQTSISFLEQYSDNLLYKPFGIRASGKQHSETGEIDSSNLRFIELVDYQNRFDDDYLESLINKASKNWKEIPDKNSWLKEVRGSYEV